MKLHISSWIESSEKKSLPNTESIGQVFVLGPKDSKRGLSLLHSHLNEWQRDLFTKNPDRAIMEFQSAHGRIWCVRLSKAPPTTSLAPEASSLSLHKNRAGESLRACEAASLEGINFVFSGCSDAELEAFLVGLELAQYRYKNSTKKTTLALSLFQNAQSLDTKLIARAAALARGVNIARHLVNLPPNVLQPVSFAKAMKELFKNARYTKIQVWDEKKLHAEKMGLHLCVGQGAQHPPCLVHLSYRPPGAKTSPVAFVGKGVTFDTGGLDIKPSKGMRLMKKDMGGAAALAGLAQWLEGSQLKIPVDFYLALAENSVDANGFRPSDVYVARNGLSVEIDNTDAEGRLVLADSLTLATEKKGSATPRCVINVATLTGAGKIALGRDIAGLYTTSSTLSKQLTAAGEHWGDFVWTMPLYRRYWDSMKSPVADMLNSGDDSYGSAITAALFLEKFVNDVPWAHLDIYAWQDRVDGALSERGGSGQAVLCLAEYLRSQALTD